MYAVIKTGGKQYRVEEGDTLRVELLGAEEGTEVVFDEVLMVNDGEELKVGAPFVEGSKVTADVVKNGRGKKLIVFKFKAKKGYRRKQGHRQPFTEVTIKKIEA